MKRRGPDARSCKHYACGGRHIYLLHSRLSIIDLNDRADQPFEHAKKTIVYNGELYNYIELRELLASRGRVFRTESDTEVLIQTLDEFGWEGLDRCEGMWAFSVYDEADGSLLLGRDRFGEKPLFLYRDHTGLYFGSEVKFIFALLGRRLGVNFAHLYRYMVNGYKSLHKTDATFFEGVSELPPGSVMLVGRSGEESLKKYWRPEFGQDDSLTYGAAVKGVREALINSVRLRLRADVPLAFCMSGGIDSNSLISIAKRVFDYDVHGFTVMNVDSRYEEREEVEHAVSELGIRHTASEITSENFLNNLTELIRQHDAPVYTISYYLHWLLMSRIAEHGYRISVSGTAADELLTGYYDHHNLYLYEIRNSPYFDSALSAWNEHVAPIVRNPHLKNPRLYFDNPSFRDHVYLNNDVFAGYLVPEWMEEFAETNYTDSLLRNRMLNELFHEAIPQILHEDDLNAMYYSIENRSPFLDRNLFEFCCRIPSCHLVRDGYAKAVLRDAMDGIVPEKILRNRRKVGFNAPVYSFLDVKNPEVKALLLDRSGIFDHVRREKIERLIAKPDLPNSESKFLFYFLNSKIFTEVFSS
jgi:asparagine synthase (glutamine-hydrolysing)